MPTGQVLWETLVSAFDTHRRIWWAGVRMLLVVLIGTAAGMTLITLMLLPALRSQAENLGGGSLDLALIALQLVIPLLFVVGAGSLVWSVGLVALSNASNSGRPVRVVDGLRAGLRRLGPAVATTLLAAGAIAVVTAAYPLVLIVAVLGLLSTPIVRWGDRRAGSNRAWPSVTTLVVMLIPFGPAVVLGTWWSLYIPEVARRGASPRQALVASRERVRGRTGTVVAVLLASVAAYVVAQYLLGLVFSPLEGSASASLGLFVGQLLMAAFPVVAMAVLAADGTGFDDGAVGRRRWRGRRGIATLWTTRIVLLSLIVPLLTPVLVVTAAAPAAAVGTDPVELTIETVPGGTLIFGEAMTIRVKPRPGAGLFTEQQPQGDIDLYVDDVFVATLLDPSPGLSVLDDYDYDATGLAHGSHTVRAEYPGDDTYEPATAVATVEVRYRTNLTLTSSGSPSDFGSPVAFSAQVTSPHGTPGGIVGFSVDYGPETEVPVDANGIATFVTSDLPVGSSEILAQYREDALFARSGRVSELHTVENAATDTTLLVEPSGSSIFGDPVTLTATIQATASDAIPTGSVDFWDGAIRIASVVPLDATGAATYSVSDLTVGPHTLSARYVPGPGFITSESDFESHMVTLRPSETVLSTAPNPSVFGQDVLLTAAVASAGSPTVPTGTVTFRDGTTALGTATLNSGTAQFAVSDLPVGSYEQLEAEYSGDARIAASTSDPLSTPHVVDKAEVDVSLVLEPSPPLPPIQPVFGDQRTLTIAVGARAPGSGTPGWPDCGCQPGSPETTVTVFADGTEVGTVELIFGTASLTLPLPTAGATEFTASFPGDNRFNAGTASLLLDIDKRPTTTNLFGSLNQSSTYGDSLTFEGAIIDNGPGSAGRAPGGTVIVGINDISFGTAATVSDGQFSVTVDNYPATPDCGGDPDCNWDVRADYLGDDFFEPSVSTFINLEVAKATTDITLSVDPVSPTLGETITVTAQLDLLGDGPTGDVTFSDDDGGSWDIAVVDGKAELQFVLLDTSKRFTASYPGDRNFEPAAVEPVDDLVITAGRAVPAIVIGDPGYVEFGDIVTISASVTLPGGLVPDGLVTIRSLTSGQLAAGLPLVAGMVELDVCAGDASGCAAGVPHLGLGSDEITVEYGPGTISTSGQASLSIQINAAKTTTVVQSTNSVIRQGDPNTFTATVTADTSPVTPTGRVVFYANETNEFGVARALLGSVDLTNGVAQLTVVGGETIDWPTDAIQADYIPDDVRKFTFTSGTMPISIGRIPVTLTPFVAESAAFAPTTVEVSIRELGFSTSDPTGTVTIVADNGETCSVGNVVATLAQTVTCSITWDSPGLHTLVASYSGDRVYEPASSATYTVDVDKGVPILAATASPGFDWVTSEPIVVSYQVFGPTTADVVVTAGAEEVCRSAALVGTCTVEFPADTLSGLSIIRVTLEESSDWQRAFVELEQDVTRCFPDLFAAIPTQGGTVTADPAPNCNGGTGYLDGTEVILVAAANDPYLFDSWGNGSTSRVRKFVVGVDGQSDQALFNRPCELLTLNAEGPGELRVDKEPNCTDPRFPQPTILTSDGAFVAGRGTDVVSGWYFSNTNVTVTATAVPQGTVTDTELYSFEGFPGWVGQSFAELRVDRETFLTARFGLACSHGTFAATGAAPADAIRAVTPPNCETVDGPGWSLGTNVEIEAVLERGQLVSEWRVDGGAVPTTGATLTVPVDGSDFTVLAVANQCYELILEVETNGWPGAVELPAAADGDRCSDFGPTFFASGTSVRLEMTDTGANPQWSDGTVVASWGASETSTPGFFTTARDFALTDDTNLTITLTNLRWCNTEPRFGGGPGDTFTWAQEDSGCLPNQVDGRFPIQVTGTPGSGSPLFGWTVRDDLGQTAHELKSSLRGTDLTTTVPPLGVFGQASINVTQCQGVSVEGILILDNGLAVPMNSQLAKAFLEMEAVSPGACPGYSEATQVFQLGSVVNLRGAADSAAFPVVSWHGDVDVPAGGNLSKTLDGATPVITAIGTVQVTCFDLAITRGGVATVDAPSCIGSRPDTNRYLGGSEIGLSARQVADEVFVAWVDVSDPAAPVDLSTSRSATLTIDRDSRLTPQYRDETTGESFVEFWEDVGDELAVAGKKVLGGLAVVGGAIIMDLPPIGTALSALSALAAGLDWLVGETGFPPFLADWDGFESLMGNVVDTVGLVGNAAACAGEWGLSASSGAEQAPPPPAPVVADDLAVMTARALLNSADRSFIEIELPDGTVESDPEVIAGLASELAEELLAAIEAGQASASDDWAEITETLSTVYASDEVGNINTVLDVLKKLDKYEVKLPSGWRLRSVEQPVYKTLKNDAKTAVVDALKGKYYSLTGKTPSSVTAGTTAAPTVSANAFKSRLRAAAPGAALDLGSLLYSMGSAGTLGWDDSAADAFGPAPELDRCMRGAAPEWMAEAFGGSGSS